MVRMMKLAAVGLAAALAMPAFAAETPHSFRQEVGVLGMGGAYTAGGWRGSALFYNPATLAFKPFHLNVPVRVEIGGVGGLGQVKDVVDYFKDNKEKLQNIETLTPTETAELEAMANKLDGKGGIIRALPAIRFGMNHFAVQTYAVFDGSPQMNSGIFQPRLNLNAYADAGIIAGYGRPLSFLPNSYAGVAVKYFQRRYLERSYALAEAADTSKSATDWLNDIRDGVTDTESGTGIDVGYLYRANKKLTLGAQAQDIVKFGDVTPPMAINLGLHYQLAKRLNFVADYRDVLNSMDRPVPFHVHFGGEVDLSILRLRAGAYQGYPTVGLGVNFWLVKIDAIYYGRERGEKLGYAPEDNIAVEIQIGLD